MDGRHKRNSNMHHHTSQYQKLTLKELKQMTEKTNSGIYYSENYLKLYSNAKTKLYFKNSLLQ